MRGRKPIPIQIPPEDLAVLRQMANRQTAPWFQVRRARILLSMHRGERVKALAKQVCCDRNTVRRTCRLYETEGLEGLLGPICRSGRPREISPPTTSADCGVGLLRADCPRVARDPLVE